MKSFNEWRNINESAPLTHADQQEIWGIVHSLRPILKPELKRLITKITSDFERNEMRDTTKGRFLDIATAQLLVELARDYDLLMQSTRHELA